MALEHTSPAQAVSVQPYGDTLLQQSSVALFKSSDLEVIRLVLPAGKTMAEHKVEGEITLQCLEGRVRVGSGADAPSQTATVLDQGQLMFLPAGVPHDVTALLDASVLVTIVLRNPSLK